MKPKVSTAAQCRALDAQAIGEWGVPGIALMEVASREVALAILTRFHASLERVLVVCGPGNNGGDGYAIARWLHIRQVEVGILSISERSTGDAGVMRDAARRLGVREVAEIGTPSLIVDAVFGTGLDREVTGSIADLLTRLAALECPVVAVDLPSGLHTDTGHVLGVVLPATHTVTFARYKPAFFTRGGEAAGTVEVVDIGLDPDALSVACCLERDVLRWPPRDPGAHKNRLGHLAVIAGSLEMAGAAVLCCEGALRAGVGLVTLFIPPNAIGRLPALSPSVMVRPMEHADALRQVTSYDAVAVGPGIGGGKPISPAVIEGLQRLWQGPGAVVFDADALVPLAGPCGGETVRTPHPGEAARLLGSSTAQIERDRFLSITRLAELGGTAVLKGRHSLVRHRSTWVNTSGSSALATAGSGDVLTGAIGALLARGISGERAAQLAVWVHGRAGELLSAECGDGWTAQEIADRIPSAAGELDVARG